RTRGEASNNSAHTAYAWPMLADGPAGPPDVPVGRGAAGEEASARRAENHDHGVAPLVRADGKARRVSSKMAAGSDARHHPSARLHSGRNVRVEHPRALGQRGLLGERA